MTASNDDFVVLGGREDLDRFLAEDALTEAGLGDRLVERRETGPAWPRGRTAYLVHESVLRSDEDFPCAADRPAVEMCRAIAADMARMFGISTSDAAEWVNLQWSDPGPAARVPRVWIVGGEEVIYHESTEYWAEFIVERRRQAPGTAPTAPRSRAVRAPAIRLPRRPLPVPARAGRHRVRRPGPDPGPGAIPGCAGSDLLPTRVGPPAGRRVDGPVRRHGDWIQFCGAKTGEVGCRHDPQSVRFR